MFTNAIGVEMRLNGIEYSNATFPICYKNHQVSDFSFDFVFPNGEIANVYSYKNKEEIEEKLEEFKTYLKLFNLKKGYLICFPLIEEDKVLIEAVENITK
ncbi:MAG: GxxExxY protein [candidate division WOR-3 bacterium]